MFLDSSLKDQIKDSCLIAVDVSVIEIFSTKY